MIPRTVHLRCDECQPASPYLAHCGATATVELGLSFDHVDDLPPDVTPCARCQAREYDPCPWCGAE